MLSTRDAWFLQGSWLYCIEHTSNSNADHFFKKYVFKVMWSMTTRRTPVPRKTARVYPHFKCSSITHNIIHISIDYNNTKDCLKEYIIPYLIKVINKSHPL